MAQNPPTGYPRISPYLFYKDAAGALEWLGRAFGLRERARMPGPDGSIAHAEMELGDGVIMLGQPGPDFRNPKHLGGAHARAAGATILREPKDEEYGNRRYDAEDPEGHRWSFAQHLGDA